MPWDCGLRSVWAAQFSTRRKLDFAALYSGYKRYVGISKDGLRCAPLFFLTLRSLALNVLPLHGDVYMTNAAEYSSNFFSSQRVLTAPPRYSGSAMMVFKNGRSVSMPDT